MSKSLTASSKVMKNYLSELLTESKLVEEPELILKKKSNELVEKEEAELKVFEQPVILKTQKDTKSLEKLLDQVSEPKEHIIKETTIEIVKEDIIKTEVPVEKVSIDTTEVAVTSKVENVDKTTDSLAEKSYRQGDFQAMFFDVAGLLVAVPLVELGGIHKVGKINSLMGKPEWYKGVMLLREEKINVVDTALWVMPEKYDESLKSSLNYQYIIMLNDSSWGLMAENLVDTVVLSQDEVKWLDSSNKRPWLAGLVKEKMCALLDVSSLITLLDEGSGILNES